MPHLHNANGKRDLHAMYRAMNDRTIDVPRYGSIATHKALKAAMIVRDATIGYGHTVDRVLLVFIDDRKDPDRLACIVFSLDNVNTLVLDVDNGGKITGKSLYDVRTAKRLPRDFMHEIANVRPVSDVSVKYGSPKVYARNISCYAAR